MKSLLKERSICAVFLLLLTTALMVSTFGLKFADLGGAFSPMFFPRIILAILMGLAAVNAVWDVLNDDAAKPIKLWPVVIVSCAIFGLVLLLVPLGYFISSLVSGIVILFALGLRSPLKLILVPGLSAAALVLLFNHVLKMPLPTSPFVWWI